jgi:hypothetical protein
MMLNLFFFKIFFTPVIIYSFRFFNIKNTKIADITGGQGTKIPNKGKRLVDAEFQHPNADAYIRNEGNWEAVNIPKEEPPKVIYTNINRDTGVAHYGEIRKVGKNEAKATIYTADLSQFKPTMVKTEVSQFGKKGKMEINSIEVPKRITNKEYMESFELMKKSEHRQTLNIAEFDRSSAPTRHPSEPLIEFVEGGKKGSNKKGNIGRSSGGASNAIGKTSKKKGGSNKKGGIGGSSTSEINTGNGLKQLTKTKGKPKPVEKLKIEPKQKNLFNTKTEGKSIASTKFKTKMKISFAPALIPKYMSGQKTKQSTKTKNQNRSFATLSLFTEQKTANKSKTLIDQLTDTRTKESSTTISDTTTKVKQAVSITTLTTVGTTPITQGEKFKIPTKNDGRRGGSMWKPVKGKNNYKQEGNIGNIFNSKKDKKLKL